jgi:hypothetical protein
MKTLDVIKLLPMDDKVKTQILNMYPHMNDEQKLSLESLAWDYYDLMYGEKVEAHIEELEDKIVKGEEHFSPENYAKVIDKTEADMKKALAEATTTTDLTAARKAMEQIMGEIRAAKAEKSAKRTAH